VADSPTEVLASPRKFAALSWNGRVDVFTLDDIFNWDCQLALLMVEKRLQKAEEKNLGTSLTTTRATSIAQHSEMISIFFILDEYFFWTTAELRAASPQLALAASSPWALAAAIAVAEFCQEVTAAKRRRFGRSSVKENWLPPKKNTTTSTYVYCNTAWLLCCPTPPTTL